MKILFVNPFYAPDLFGGAEVVLQNLAEGLASKGVDVSVIATTEKAGLCLEHVNGVKVWRAGLKNVFWHCNHSAKRPFLTRAVWRLIDVYNPWMMEYIDRVVSEESPTVASVHNLTGWSVSAWSVLMTRQIPIVQVLHDYQLMCRGLMYTKHGDCSTQCGPCKLMRFPQKQLSGKLTGVVGVSQSILDRYVNAGFFPGVPDRRVIYNARTANDLLSAIRADSPVESERPFRFGYIGALAPHKGVEMLVREFVKGSGFDSELWLAGEGGSDYTSRLKQLAADHRVVFLGRVFPDQFYSNVDVVVVPSLWSEPLSTVILESTALGKPVICSLKGGNPEMVKHGENGFIFNPDRPSELFEALRRMRADYEASSFPSVHATGNSLFSSHDRFLNEHLSIYSAAESHGSAASVLDGIV